MRFSMTSVLRFSSSSVANNVKLRLIERISGRTNKGPANSWQALGLLLVRFMQRRTTSLIGEATLVSKNTGVMSAKRPRISFDHVACLSLEMERDSKMEN